MKIEKGKTYRIKGNSEYFKDKYGTANPMIEIEDTDENVFGGSWEWQAGNPACMLFGMRCGMEGVEPGSKVWYGKIGDPTLKGARMGELVSEKELI